MPHQHLPLSEREEDIIQAVYTYRYLTLNQVTRLFFAKTSKHYAGGYLRRLTHRGVLARFPLPATHKGNREYIYTLTSHGAHYLRSLGKDISVHRYATEEAPSYKHLQHSLAVNDLLIAATLLPRETECVTLRDLRSEWMLKQSPFHLSLREEAKRGKTDKELYQQSVIPDGWLDFRLRIAGKNFQTAVWVELDQQTEEQKQFRRKVRSLHAIATNSVCLQQLGVKTFTIAIANAVGGEKRRDQLRSWVKQELLTQGTLPDAYLFLFTSLPAGEITPQTIFLTPTWISVNEDTLLPLLDLT